MMSKLISICLIWLRVRVRVRSWRCILYANIISMRNDLKCTGEYWRGVRYGLGWYCMVGYWRTPAGYPYIESLGWKGIACCKYRFWGWLETAGKCRFWTGGFSGFPDCLEDVWNDGDIICGRVVWKLPWALDIFGSIEFSVIETGGFSCFFNNLRSLGCEFDACWARNCFISSVLSFLSWRRFCSCFGIAWGWIGFNKTSIMMRLMRFVWQQIIVWKNRGKKYILYYPN